MNEKKKIHRVIDRAVKRIVGTLGKDVISIYKTGTILTKDQVYDSDIDIIAIVEPNFDFRKIDRMNAYFWENKDTVGEGYKIGVLGLGMDEIAAPYKENSNNPLSETKLIYRVLRGIPHIGYWLWGKKLPIRKLVNDFSHSNQSYLIPFDEAENQIGYIRSEIRKIRKGDFSNYTKLPKFCLVLVRCEAMIEHNFEYDPLLYNLYRHMKHLEGHIIHRCMELRPKSDLRKEEVLEFCDEVEDYIKECKQKIHKKLWK